MPNALLTLGSNVNPEGYLPAAIEMLQQGIARGGSVRVSYLRAFAPDGAAAAGQSPDFVNGAVLLDVEATPRALREHLHRLEAALGRVRGRILRRIDIDLAWIEDPRVQQTAAPRAARVNDDASQRRALGSSESTGHSSGTSDQLVLPQPGLDRLAYLVLPAADLMPDWVHPSAGRTLAELARTAMTQTPSRRLYDLETRVAQLAGVTVCGSDGRG